MERAIATQQTGWSFVSQLRSTLPDALGGILWFGTDDTNTTVYMPFYCSMTAVPHELSEDNGDLLTFSMDSNFWMNNWVANQAYHRYDLMIPDIRKVQGRLESEFISSRDAKDNELLQLYNAGEINKMILKMNVEGAEIAKKATDEYRSLAQFLLVRYLDGNRKQVDEDGNFIYTKEHMPARPDFPGYNKEYYENIVKSTGNHFQVD
jgi:dipeptidase